MSSASSTFATPSISIAHPAGDALRVVLFGMPDAGKSSLLGALAQTSQSQDRGLHGRLLDMTHGLAELWRRVYENHPRETLDEIVPYPVYFESYIPNPDGESRLALTLYDCDGRVANEILSQRRALENDPKVGPLVQAVLNADALILAVDASANDSQIDQDFRDFVQFLETIQNYRSQDRAVGGLPVHLVLTKCDLLARELMSAQAWEERIEERKQQVIQRFSDFLRIEGVEGFNFGSIDLQVNATAVKRPGLAETPARPREPFGVAELFYECFEDAQEFRDRVARADRRLRYTVFGASGLLGALALAALLLFAFGAPSERPPDLAMKVETYQQNEGSLPERLSDKNLERRKKELLALRDDPGFAELAADKKQFIRARLDEIQAYENFRVALRKVPSIATVRSLEALAEIKKQLETDAAIPKAYTADWDRPQNAPEAVADRRKRLEQIDHLAIAVDELRRFYAALDKAGLDLLYDTNLDKPLMRKSDASWEADFTRLLEKSKSPPFSKTDPQRSAAYEFAIVETALQEWEVKRASLQRLHDFALALGILGDKTGTTAPLFLGDATADSDFNALAAQRLQNLRARFPDYRSWTLADLKSPVRPRFQERLEESYQRAIIHGQKLILRRLIEINPTGPETHGDWLKIAEWLSSAAVRDWSEVIQLLAKYINPEGSDPVGQTVAFLRKNQFDIEIRSLKISIPDNLSDNPLRPDDEFIFHHRIAVTGISQDYKLKRSGQGTRQGTAMVYEYRPPGGNPLTFTLAPGDDLSPTLLLREGMKSWELAWLRCRSVTYQMERLSREPLLRDGDKPNSAGESARGVTVQTEGKLPQVPALIPAVLYPRK